MRARLALAASGIAFEPCEVALRAKPAALLAASPKGTVPVLVLPGGQVIDESLHIMRWALRQHDPMQWLERVGDATEAARADRLIAQCDGPFKHALDRYKYPNRYQESGAISHREQGAVFLNQLEGLLQAHPLTTPGVMTPATRQADAREGIVPAQHCAYLLRSSPSLADMAIAPFVRQFANTDPAWFAAQAWPALATWLTAFEASALFASIMIKQPLGSAQ